MATYRGVRVSRPHKKFLTAYERKHNAPVQLNDGQRTKALQLLRIKVKGIYNRITNPHGAAPYSPNAPHVKSGHDHHALDINQGHGKGQRDHVAQFYKDHGVKGVFFNVPTEGWHVDFLDEQSLKDAAAKLKVDRQLKFGDSGNDVIALKKLLYAKGIKHFSSLPNGKPSNNRYSRYYGKHTRFAVRRFQEANGLPADGVVGPATWAKLRK